jgi:hypothetical protein
MALAFLASAVSLSVADLHDPTVIRWRFIIIAALMGMTLLYRYLKFFRQYSYELLLRYAELPSTELASTATGAK